MVPGGGTDKIVYIAGPEAIDIKLGELPEAIYTVVYGNGEVEEKTFAELFPDFNPTQSGLFEEEIRYDSINKNISIFVYDYTQPDFETVFSEVITKELQTNLQTPDLTVLRKVLEGKKVFLNQEAFSSGPMTVMDIYRADPIVVEQLIPFEAFYKNTFRGPGDGEELILTGSYGKAYQSIIDISADEITVEHINANLVNLANSDSVENAGKPVSGVYISGDKAIIEDSSITLSDIPSNDIITVGIYLKGPETRISDVKISGFETSLALDASASGEITNVSFDSPIVINTANSGAPDFNLRSCISLGDNEYDVIVMVEDTENPGEEISKWVEAQKAINSNLSFGYGKLPEVEIGGAIIEGWEDGGSSSGEAT